MSVKIKSLTLLCTSLDEAVTQRILEVNGIVDAKIYKSGENYRFDYILTPNSNEYDVMVTIMETLLEEFNIDSEPFIENSKVEEKDDSYDDMVIIRKAPIKSQKTSEQSIESNLDVVNENASEHLQEDFLSESERDEDEHDDNLNKHDEEAEKKAFKVKILELSLSLIIFIVGLSLSFIESVEKIYPYIVVVAFVIAGYEVVFEGVSKIIKGKVFSEEFLMVVASLAAIALGEVFEAFGIMFLFSVGELFEHRAVDNSKSVVNALKKMMKNDVVVIKNGKEVLISPNMVEVGEIIVVRAGEKVILDGKIIEGRASFDTKTVTGESVPTSLSVGDCVYGGFINKDGVIKIEVTKNYENSTLLKIAKIVEKSSKNKSKQESFIAKFSKFYTPIVVVLAVLLAFVPPIFSTTYLEGLKVWGVRAIMLLCVSCPCALVISVPLAYFCGVGAAAKKGVLIKATNSLETLSGANTFVFDKTGTLTKGDLKVTKIICNKNYQGKVLEIAGAAEKYSNHPIALAIVKKAGEINKDVKDYKEIAGLGVCAVYENKQLLVGNAKLLDVNHIKYIKAEDVGVKIYVALGGEYVGCIILNDEIKQEAYGCILELRDSGIENTVMLTGDNKDYAVKVRKELKMNKSISELMPEDKVLEIERIISENRDKKVAYVGDGINDAPVLTRADVGFAMGALGSDVAIESADIVINDDDLSKLPFAFKLAKRTKKIAYQNSIISLLVKFGVIALSVFGITSSLWLAIGSDVGVMILAVLNSIRNKNRII